MDDHEQQGEGWAPTSYQYWKKHIDIIHIIVSIFYVVSTLFAKDKYDTWHIWILLSFHGCWVIGYQAMAMAVHSLPHNVIQRCQGSQRLESFDDNSNKPSLIRILCWKGSYQSYSFLYASNIFTMRLFLSDPITYLPLSYLFCLAWISSICLVTFFFNMGPVWAT